MEVHDVTACAVCKKVEEGRRAWPAERLEKLFRLDYNAIDLRTWKLAGLCDACGNTVWSCMYGRARAAIGNETPFPVREVPRDARDEELMAAFGTLYRSVALNKCQWTPPSLDAVENARRVLNTNHAVLGVLFRTTGHATDRSQVGTPADTRASRKAREVQAKVNAATAEAVATGGQLIVFEQRDRQRTDRDDQNYGAMKRRPSAQGKENGKKKEVAKRDRREKRFG